VLFLLLSLLEKVRPVVTAVFPSRHTCSALLGCNLRRIVCRTGYFSKDFRRVSKGKECKKSGQPPFFRPKRFGHAVSSYFKHNLRPWKSTPCCRRFLKREKVSGTFFRNALVIEKVPWRPFILIASALLRKRNRTKTIGSAFHSFHPFHETDEVSPYP
jgi:hypothetical protein